jgi:predicted O-methyltransferase YrrM
MIKKFIKSKLKSVILEFKNLESVVVQLNSRKELMKIFDWEQEPLLDFPQLYEYKTEVDINERRIRDAESLGTVMRNKKPMTALEIGTASGLATSLMSINSPDSKIFTININPEEITSGKGGKLTTVAMKKEDIGREYRQRHLKNITQVYANTATWEPDIGNIDLAFIDGCHDTEFVYNDTKKCLKHMKPGSFILWHDFNLGLVKKYNWINSVCLAVERLCEENVVRGRIYTVRDSWIGIYQVPTS